MLFYYLVMFSRCEIALVTCHASHRAHAERAFEEVLLAFSDFTVAYISDFLKNGSG